jgi:cellobiose phosphorylase
MVAEAMAGRAEQAFTYYKTILPSATNDIADIHWTEPYVYSQMIAGKEHKDFGQAKNSWLTGTAAWNFVAASQYILGIRPTFEGLMIDPCIPKTWKGFKVSRVCRGVRYNINVTNPSKVSKGIKSVKVDGLEIKGNVIPFSKAHKDVTVEVVMG